MDDHLEFLYKPKNYRRVRTCKDGRIYNRKRVDEYHRESVRITEAISVINLLHKCQRMNPKNIRERLKRMFGNSVVVILKNEKSRFCLE